MTSRREVYRFEKPIAADYETPSGVSCVNVYIPDDLDHLPLLQGLMATLTKPEFWDGTEADRVQRAYLWEVAWAETDWGQCMEPSQAGNQARVSLWARWSDVETGGAISPSVDNTQLFNHVVFQTGAAQFDGTSQLVWLPAGTYAASVLYRRNTLNGVLSCSLEYLADESFTTVINAADLRGTLLANQVVSGTFTLTQAGEYKFHWFVQSTTGTGYQYPLTVTEIWKTGD